MKKGSSPTKTNTHLFGWN